MVRKEKMRIPCAEALMSQLRRQRTIASGFRLPISAAEAEQLLTVSYMAEVRLRGHVPHIDSDTKRAISEVAHELTRTDIYPTGIMLCGTPGNGKTTLMYALQNAVLWLQEHGMFSQRDEENHADRIRLVTAKQICTESQRRQLILDYKRQAALGIDDLGNEPAEVLSYGNVCSPVVDLIEDRYNTLSFTMVTTNLTGVELRKRYGERVVDRMNEMMKIVIFKNASFR